MEGHGVVEVDIPDIEPVPGSKYVYILSVYIPDVIAMKALFGLPQHQ